MSKTFDETLAEAAAALSVVGTGKLRKATIISEGPRSFPAVTTQNQDQKPASSRTAGSDSSSSSPR